MPGTNLFAPEQVTTGVKVALADEFGFGFIVKCATGNIPSGVAGYAVGCILVDTTSGTPYKNTGTTTSCTFSAI